MIEKGGKGIYNVAGRERDLTTLIEAARATAPVPPRVTWVRSSGLSTQRDKDSFTGLLFWQINKGYLTGFSDARALAQGLTTRSMRLTMADELRWLEQQPPETTVFAGFRRKPDGSGFDRVTVPWPVYLVREKGLIGAWREQDVNGLLKARILLTLPPAAQINTYRPNAARVMSGARAGRSDVPL